MNRKLIQLSIIFLSLTINIFSQSPYTTKEQNFLKKLVDIYPFVGPEIYPDRENIVFYNYIHDSHKRVKPLEDTNISKELNELSTIKIHLTTDVTFEMPKNNFNFGNTYLMVEKTFFPNWWINITPFATLAGKYSLDINGNSKGDISFYDTGIEIISLTRILMSFRMRSVNDISDNTFMLLPSVVDYSSINSDTPHWYLPRIVNAPGFRVGMISYWYELSYSQGFLTNGSPLSAMLRVNNNNFFAQVLYEHSFDTSLYNSSYNNTRDLLQISALSKIPLPLDFCINILGEYTWQIGVAHYTRVELGVEWNIINFTLRNINYIAVKKENKENKNELFLLEYALFIKYYPITFGFQGTTDGRYYITARAVF